jgi:hypothetical protein
MDEFDVFVAFASIVDGVVIELRNEYELREDAHYGFFGEVSDE